MKPYFKLDKEFHQEIIKILRKGENNGLFDLSVSTSTSSNMNSFWTTTNFDEFSYKFQ